MHIQHSLAEEPLIKRYRGITFSIQSTCMCVCSVCRVCKGHLTGVAGLTEQHMIGPTLIKRKICKILDCK